MNPSENPNQFQQPAQAGPQGTADPRATFAPPTQPGMVIPGNPNAPITTPVQRPAINPNSTQNHLQIAEIRDGVVIMNDGSFRSVIMVKSINFDLMSPTEKEAVEYSYQGFLNSLYFPIQIFIRSQKIDLGPYIEKLDKIRGEHDNMLLALLMDDYINFIDQLASQTNIMDKHFYVVIPFFPHQETQNQKPLASSKSLFSGVFKLFGSTATHVVINEAELEAAKTELRNRVQAALGGLMQCGIQGLPLDTQELIELYYDTYNPDTATRQQLKNFGDMTVPVVTKGAGQAPQPNLDKELQ
jgi:AraC-like DNA-binding protein